MLEILCGPIACGKSTYAQKRAEDGAIIVNDDSIVESLHAGNYKLYNPELKCLYKSIENHIISYAIALHKDVIIDRPNYSKHMRARYIALAKSLDVTSKIIVWNWDIHPFILAERRYYANSRGLSLEVWTKVAQEHLSKYERPSLEEGAGEIYYV